MGVPLPSYSCGYTVSEKEGRCLCGCVTCLAECEQRKGTNPKKNFRLLLMINHLEMKTTVMQITRDGSQGTASDR